MHWRGLIVLLSAMLVFSCARKGSPDGGPRDLDPPKYLNSNPDTMAIKVSTDLKEIRIQFNEYLILKDFHKNIVISPPFQRQPTFLPVGTAAKAVRIKLNEELQDSTTYNINFGNAIQDNNEGNVLPYFQFVFSTGDYIDSLEISGKITAPFLKEQPKKMIAGLFRVDSAYTDSLILRQKPLYIAKADTANHYKLNYLRKGRYRLAAFNDENENLMWDREEEFFGFATDLIDLEENTNVDLLLFKPRQSLRAEIPEQKGYGHFVFRFKGNPEAVNVQPLDFEFSTSETFFTPKSDSLDFWFDPSADTLAEASRRISFAVTADGVTDTLSAVYAKDREHQLRIDRKMKLEAAPGRPPVLTSNHPIKRVDTAFVSVLQDSISLPLKLIPTEGNPYGLIVDFPMEIQSEYEVQMLPGAIRDWFGETNDTLVYKYVTAPKAEYGNLKLKIENKPEKPFWIELLDENDKVLESEYSTQSEFNYNYLRPGRYYFRMLVDENENGFWDQGDIFEGLQPEPSYVFPATANVRALWDVEETWVIRSEEGILEEIKNLDKERETAEDTED